MSIYIPGAGIEIPTGDYIEPPGDYEGVILTKIPDGLLRFKGSATCYVSGTGGNPFGHAVLLINPSIGYVHSCEPGTHPVRFMPHDQWGRFLEETAKTMWGMLPLKLPDKTAARNYVTECMLRGYCWVPWHDCVTFCDLVVEAAGGTTKANTVFPSTATKQAGVISQPKFKHPWDAIGDGDL
ncbi:MAG: hypothetical protein J5I93_16145 [Pirellulaceae bacterium]|nr:hypothetical protein [Pirellulaceae bacterium]